MRNCRPDTGGFHEQVAMIDGEDPVVARDRHEGILLPLKKNRTFPAVFTVTVMVTATPLLAAPEIVGTDTWLISVTFVTVIDID